MTDPQFIASLEINGIVLTAWESVSVAIKFKDPIRTFEFVAAEGAYGPGFNGLRFNTGDSVNITLGGQPVITNGAATTRTGAFDQQSKQLVIAGKSTHDLLRKSSVPIQQGSYDGYTFQQAAQAITQPFGINVSLQNAPDVASKPFTWCKVQYGETCAAFLNRMAGMRGMWLTSNANGDLVAANANPSGGAVANLVEGQNILKCTFKFDDQTAVSKYGAKSQTPGSDTTWPSRFNSASVTNTDGNSNVSKMQIAPHPMDSQELQAFASYQFANSSWPIVDFTVTVPGWFKDDGTLWEPIDNVTIYSPTAIPTASSQLTLTISEAVFQQDTTNGTTTTLKLCLPQFASIAPGAGVSDIPNTSMPAAQSDPPDYTVST